MPVTNFPNGVTSYGGPVLPAAAGGLPFTGYVFFVDYAKGADGNDGSADTPFKTITKAYALCRNGKNDTIVLIGNGSATGYQALTQTLVLSKNAVHIVGAAAPSANGNTARIAASAGSAGFTPLVQVTGTGCLFSNFSVVQGYAAAVDQTGWLESGDRNYYSNVFFGGMANATPAGRAASRSIVIDGGTSVALSGLGNHTFDGCVFGLDSVARSAANATLELSGGTQRNYFRGCVFKAYATNAGVLHVKTSAAAAIANETIFERCSFINAIKSASAVAMTQGWSIAATAGGLFLLKSCSSIGATKIETTPSGFIYVDGGAPTAATTGYAVNNT